MKSLEVNNAKDSHPLGKLTLYPTRDGTLSLKSTFFKEAFHCSSGALKEAKEKFIFPSEIKRFRSSEYLNVLDICVGLGYNYGCLLEEVIKNSISLKWYGLELDSRPLSIAIKNKFFTQNFSSETIKIINSTIKSKEWRSNNSEGNLFLGDARSNLKRIPNATSFDVIMLDPFSPQRCPELWTEEFLIDLVSRLSPEGRLITYCTAAAIRKTLREAGLQIKSLIPNKKNKTKWSNGTIAIRTQKESSTSLGKHIWQPLTKMEEEHLLTKASIPYRDLSGKDNAKEIKTRREKEQQQSYLESTSSWQKRWERVNSPKSY